MLFQKTPTTTPSESWSLLECLWYDKSGCECCEVHDIRAAGGTRSREESVETGFKELDKVSQGAK